MSEKAPLDCVYQSVTQAPPTAYCPIYLLRSPLDGFLFLSHGACLLHGDN